ELFRSATEHTRRSIGLQMRDRDETRLTRSRGHRECEYCGRSTRCEPHQLSSGEAGRLMSLCQECHAKADNGTISRRELMCSSVPSSRRKSRSKRRSSLLSPSRNCAAATGQPPPNEPLQPTPGRWGDDEPCQIVLAARCG